MIPLLFRKIFFNLILLCYLSINWTIAQDNSNNSFLDGPNCFYSDDSLIVNYYNFGINESFTFSQSDTNVFNGFFKDSLVTYILPNQFASPVCEYYNVNKIFVVSDIHGQYEVFRQLLLANGIIDESNSWIWGDGHLVILGDVFDRGSQVHEALWLIYNLENQARDSGGIVHFILGNHEIMVMQNDLRYVNEKYFSISEALNIEPPDLYNENTFWGRWLRSKNFVTIIDSILFVHGGLHPDLINQYNSIDDINKIMRINIDTDRNQIKEDQELSTLFRGDGPIWYRGYFEPDTMPEISDEGLSNILDHFYVNKIVVGHTTIDSIQTFFNNHIINVDGGIKYGNRGEGLLILSNQFYAVDSNGKQRKLF